MLWTERCLAWSPGAGSGSRPASFAPISSQWAGMMSKKTFATITVPIIAPTWSHAARGLKSSAEPSGERDEREEHGPQHPAVRARPG